MGKGVPVDVFLNHAPLGTDLVVDIVEPRQFLLLPTSLVDRGVFEVHPTLSYLDFRAFKTLASHLLGDLLPLFGAQLRIEHFQ